MPQSALPVLDDPAVRAALMQAWEDSLPGKVGAHEEGGFIVRRAEGSLETIRWPRGDQDTIIVPTHPGYKIDQCDIVLTFHTHPNPGSDYLQEPGEADRRAVRGDPDLKGRLYVGELVISQANI